MKIITDTNIWHSIQNGKYPPNLSNGNILVATYINLFELSLTPHLIDNLEFMSKVIKTLHDSHQLIIEINPIEYIIKKQYPDYQVRDVQYSKMIRGFEKLMNIDFAKVNKEQLEEASEEFKKTIEAWRDTLQKLADIVNDSLPQVRENIKNSTGKKVHRKIHSLPLYPEILNLYVKSFTESEIELDIENYPWDEIELFIRVWDNYFKDLEVSPNQKFQANDWFDLFNLAYVDKDSQYWTDENKWIELILKDKNTSHKLFTI